MKATELMIGDYITVTPSGMLIQVAAVHKKKVAYHTCTSKLSLVREGLLRPIPLTPEILEKNGFSVNYHEDDLCYAQSCGDVIGIHIYGINGLMEEMYFKYVHELQHALKLCGIKKEIEL